MKRNNWKSYPHKDCQFWLYTPNEGMVFFKTEEERDQYAAVEISCMKDGGFWDEEVEDICAGAIQITHKTVVVDKIIRPETLDEDDCDENGEWWDEDCKWKGNYELKPINTEDDAGGE